MRHTSWLTGLITGLTLLSGSAFAHPIWMHPSEFHLSTEDPFWITVDATASHGVFSFDKPIGVDQVSVYRPNGDRQRLGPYYKGQRRTVFDLLIDQAGTHKVELRGQPRYMTRYVIGERNTARRAFGNKLEVQLPEGAREVTTVAVQNIAAFFITQGAPTTGVLETTGEGFELHALTHPSDVVQGEEARFRFTFDGQPATGLRAELVPHGTAWRDSRRQIEITGDEDGVLSFTPQQTGPHLLSVHLNMAIENPLADSVAVNYLVSLEVLP
ncbi:DUF4198 domain-containing protein [Marinospirillum sp.]|uniref:DUF4198 domain-containing protein n=1 Tax=Marinospirillum sp. TaxID=2183934 RepID=UPI003A886F1F